MYHHRSQRDLNALETRRVKPIVPMGKRLNLVKGLLIASVMIVSNAAVAAGLEAEPTSLDFGQVPIEHSSVEQPVTLSNTGFNPIRLGLIDSWTTVSDATGNITTIRSPEFIISHDPCSNTEIASSEECEVGLVFRPLTVGAKGATLSIPSNDHNTPVNVSLSGNGTEDPNIEPTVRFHDFGEIKVGSSSKYLTINIYNTGIERLNIQGVTVSGDNNDFTVSDYCSNDSIRQTSYCTLEARFKPQSEGLKTIIISIPSNDPNTPVLEIVLKGGKYIVPIPDIKVEPLSQDFGKIQVGSQSSPLTVIKISNIGYAPLELGQIQRTGADDFVIDYDLCSNKTVGPSKYCSVVMHFEPQFLGVKVANLSIPSNDPDMPAAGVPLRGIGTMSCDNFEFSSYPESPDFGTEIVGHSRPIYQWVNIRADGCTSAVRIEDVKITGTNASEFSINDESCYHGSYRNTFYSSCYFTSRFSPTSAGTKSAELTVTLNDTSKRTIPLLAKAITSAQSQPSLEVPSSYNFGLVTLGIYRYFQVFVKNTGNVNLKFNSISITGENSGDFYAYGCYNRILNPSQQCAIYVYFRASSTGSKQANLSFSSDLLPVKNVQLTGEVTDQPVDCSDANITIESVADGAWAEESSDMAYGYYYYNRNSYNQPTDAWRRLQNFNDGEEATPNRPREGDVVLIRAGHKITGIPYVNVKALCIEEGGTLESFNDQGTWLSVYAEDYIENKGVIRGKTGANEANDTTTSCSNNYWSSVGRGKCAKPGAGISLGVQSYRGLFLNEGNILAGHGGEGKRFTGYGGNINIRATGITNTGEAIIDAGRGGNITGTQSGQAGWGGNISIWGNDYLKSDGRRILAGNGGNCNPNATAAQNGGNGGNLWLNARSSVDLLNGTFTTGRGGTNCGPNGTNGRDGRFNSDPSVLTLSGVNTKIEGGDVVIFGGDDWLLNLSNLSENAITATGDITIAVGEGGAVDMRNNTDEQGNAIKILKAGGQVNVFADDVLRDPGVILDDLIEATNIVTGPSKILRDVFLTAESGSLSGDPNTVLPVRLTLANGGPETDTYSINVTDTAGWTLGELESSVEVEGLESVGLEFDVTLSSTPKEANVITVTAISQADPSVMASIEVQVTTDGSSSGNVASNVVGAIQPVSTCPSTGVIEWLCRSNHDQVLTDVTIQPGVNIGGGSLAGVVNNFGMISQVKVQAGAVVNGGKMTGYIESEGTLANIEFVGIEVAGGALDGTVLNNSQVGGTFRDVSLTANTVVEGGYLAGHVEGDCEAPAQLKNLTVKEGSFLSCVTLGEGVLVNGEVTCGEGVTAEEGVCSEPDETPDETEELPSLGAVVKNLQGETIDTEAALFAGGISINEGTFEPSANQGLSDIADIRGQITVLDSEHLGQPAELVVYAAYWPPGVPDGEEPIYFMLDENHDIPLWDNDLLQLVPFRILDELDVPMDVEIYQGPFVAPGTLNISFGYRLLGDDKVVQNAQTLDVTITADEDETE